MFSNRKRLFIVYAFAFTMLLAGMSFNQTTASAAKGKYTVKTSTKPCNSTYTKDATYNKKTKHYYMLRSYLEKLEKDGGGTLTLKKGTYNIPCTLYVPSNVTIKFKKGVTLNKTTKTGTKKLKASSSMFELVPPSKSAKKGKVAKYKSSKNVSFVGTGNTTINMKKRDESVAIVMGHNKNVSISGIKFKNMKGGSFLTIAGCNNVTVSGCTFYGHTDLSGDANLYAVRLEVPDSKTKAFPYKWSKTDKTANQTINITGNKFSKLNSAIGSDKYTESVNHSGISVTSNTFSSLDNNAIRILNWNTPVIQSNTFSNIAGGSGTYCGILASGVIEPTITANTFDYVGTPIKIVPATNTGKGKTYTTTYSTISSAYATYMESNNVTNAVVYYVMYQKTTSATSISRLAYYADLTTRDYVITPGMTPYRDHYTDHKWYNTYTHDYYVFKSYFEQLEKVGGGTLTVAPGTYTITNTLYVPSNTTVYFQDGVTINKGTNTGFSSTVLVPSISIFQLVNPSHSTIEGIETGYNGAHDISFIGQGNVTIDLVFYENTTAFVLCHNKNIRFEGINFKNYWGHHFFELDASDNVTIQNCSFSGSKYSSSDDDHKEAINIDTPDRNTGGFSQIWTSYDRTPNSNIYIVNNTFTDTLRAIGTHKYSVSPLDGVTQYYHTNVQLLNNIITNTKGYAIRTINWKDCVIKGNTIKNVNSGKTEAILMSGAVNPTITENTIDTASRAIRINSADNSTSPQADKIYPISHSILDSKERTGVNISAMLNNTLIDVEDTYIRYIVNGEKKSSTTECIDYEFDEDKLHYTKPTPTPKPTKDPSPSPSPSVSPDTSASPSPDVTTEPSASPEPSQAPSPSPSAAPDTQVDPAA